MVDGLVTRAVPVAGERASLSLHNRSRSEVPKAWYDRIARLDDEDDDAKRLTVANNIRIQCF